MSDATRQAVVGPGGCVLHIGMMKTATTSIQGAASQHRSDLLKHGVRYPGIGLNHSEALSSILGPGGVRYDSERHDVKWDRLVAERDQNPKDRLFLSSELIAGTNEEAVDRLIAQFGPELHVVLTVRPLAQLLPSAWQQYVKQRTEVGYRKWLKRVVVEREGKLAKRVWAKYGMVQAARPWVDRLGPERVTVVMLDKTRPELAFESFESLLGLPDGLLSSNLKDDRANRGLSYEEVELVRLVNQRVKDPVLDATEYRSLVRFALVDGLQNTRVPTPEEGRLRLPPQRATRIEAVAKRQIRKIRDLGVNVIGDLSSYAVMPKPDAAPVPPVTHVPANLVDDAVRCVKTAKPGGGRWRRAVGHPAPSESDRPPVPIEEAADIVTAAILRARDDRVRAAGDATVRRLQRWRGDITKRA
ncbi:hypothetical protein [Demequina sp. NBRC 110054]|uniref:hypothetical protein n=1 Tax=Demequina sp. NBRC 110054 TaxID=1570343 RepID=UPI000A076C86|nr:hypothetical protein [Demequina sp. NBRC 110054]